MFDTYYLNALPCCEITTNRKQRFVTLLTEKAAKLNMNKY